MRAYIFNKKELKIKEAPIIVYSLALVAPYLCPHITLWDWLVGGLYMCKQTPQLSLPLHSCPRLRHRPVHTGGEVHSLSGKDDLGTRPWIQGIPGPQVSAAWSKREARDLSGCIPSAVRISCGEQWGWSRARGASEVGHLTSSCLGQRAIVLTLSAVSFPPFQHLFEEMAIKEQRKSLPLPGRLSLRFQEKWEPICGQ